jgi:hypothetical protein
VHVYEARYGLGGKTAWTLGGCILFTALLLGLPDIDQATRIGGLLLFGGGGLALLTTALSRKTALRVDETGILLGGWTPRYRASTLHVPWQDIAGVVLWHQVLPGTWPMPYVGVVRREGLPPVPVSRGWALRATARALVPVPYDVLLTSRPVNGWRLDEERLAAAVRHFAPDVRITDQR